MEAAADEIDLLGRDERERVGRAELGVEQREAQRRLVVHGRVQHERDAGPCSVVERRPRRSSRGT